MYMARECLKNPLTKRYILPQIGIDIEKEMEVVASDAVVSIFL